MANLDDLTTVPGVTPQMLNVMKQETYLAPFTLQRHRSGGSEGRRRSAAVGDLRDAAGAGGHAGVYLVPV